MWKLPRSPSWPLSGLQSTAKHSGMALVMVLACLVLIAGLLVAFLQVVRTDLNAARGYASGAEARRLADSTLNLVIGQMQKATGNASVAWMSQPGLIRTFDTAGQPLAAYKLYSSDVLEVIGEFNPISDTPPADWASFPDLFTDLNPPLRVAGKTVYPILDASALNQAGVLDADGTGEPDIEGFSVNDPNFFAPANGEQPARLAMPVRWLYVLQDGSYAVASPSAGGGASLSKLDGSAVDSQNPPVARIAFWTDDESSKVNINTASAGTPWDTPVANVYPGHFRNIASSAGLRSNHLPIRPSNWSSNYYEIDFAHFQPSRNEYQRYPGHPATTSLLPILGEPIARAIGENPGDARRVEVKNHVLAMNPRYSGGAESSLHGTRRGTDILSLTNERLYASLDELLFAQPTSMLNRPENPLAQTPEAKRDVLEKSKFFLTAHSRAPEITLSNRPRVVVWPVNATPNPTGSTNITRSSFDELIAFCGTVGSGSSAAEFFFTRSDPLSSSADWTPRNQRIYRYLQDLTDRPIPGFGGRFSTKFGVDRDQVLTQIVDYIRCLNLQDTSVRSAYTTPIDSNGIPTNNETRGQVIPLLPPSGSAGHGTRGFGRIAILSEMALVLGAFNEDTSTKELEVQLAIYPELAGLMAGYSIMPVNMRLIFDGLDGLRINGNPVPFPSSKHEMWDEGFSGTHGMSTIGGYMGVYSGFLRGSGVNQRLPPLSEVFRIPNSGPLVFNGGSSFRVRVEAPVSSGGGEVLYEYEFQIPSDIRMPLPRVRQNRRFRDGDTPPTPSGQFSRIPRLTSSNFEDGIDGRDTVLSFVPSGGNPDIQDDFRMMAAALPDTDSGRFFAPHPLSSSGTNRQAHGLRAAINQYTGRSAGNLVAGMTPGRYEPGGFNNNRSPDVTHGTNGVTMTSVPGLPGDWDNGPALVMDGPWLNKPDEGANTTTSGGYTGTVPYIGHENAIRFFGFQQRTLFSPNRQMPSPVMFGSLPVGVKRGYRWQTLLFRPGWLIPSALPAGTTNHPGAASPPDHLILDNFWMPVVEPYAISEPFSTAGKINLNYQIAPFSYIRRDTGIRAVLDTVLITALDPDSPSLDTATRTLSQRYKQGDATGPVSAQNTGFAGAPVRFGVDLDATLKFFDERFLTNRPFISASEICEIPLVPNRADHTGVALASPGDTQAELMIKLRNFWRRHILTGDNSLERPYAHIYPRVTTKSNTFNVHVHVQSLKKTALTEANKFEAGKDLVLGEFRGSFLIERYLDMNTVEFDMDDPNALLGPYRVRILNSKQL